MSKRKLDAGESGHLQVEVERLKADLEMARRGLEMKNNEVFYVNGRNLTN